MAQTKKESMSTDAALLQLEVQIGSLLWEKLALPQQAGNLIAKLAGRMEVFCEDFGIANRMQVSLTRCPIDRLLRLRINDSCHTACTELTSNVWNSVMPGIGAAPLSQQFSIWLATWLSREPAPDTSAKLEAFVIELSDAIVRRHPEAFFDIGAATDLLERVVFLLDTPQAALVVGLNQERLIRILRPVLEVGTSLSDQVCVLRMISNGLAAHKTDQEISETLIGTLSEPEIRVRLGPDCWLVPLRGTDEKITEFPLGNSAINEDMRSLFQRMLNSVLYEMGIRVHRLLFEINPQQDALTFRVLINRHLSAPQPLLRPDECVAIAQPDELPIGVEETRELVNQETGAILSAVPKSHEKALREAGLEVLDPANYFLQCIRGEIEREGWRLVNCEAVATELALLDSEYAIVALAAQQKLKPECLAPVLRRLLKEQVPISDFVRLLENLLAFERVTADSLNFAVLEDRFVVHPKLGCRQGGDTLELAEYARSGLKRSIARRIAPRCKLRVYEIDPGLQMGLLDHLAARLGDSSVVQLDFEALDKIRLAILDAQSIRGRDDSQVAIVCSSAVRFFVHELIADDLPRLPVLSYEEIAFGSEIAVQSLPTIRPGGGRDAVP